MYLIVIIFVLTTILSGTCLKELVVKILILLLPAGLCSQDLSGLREKILPAGSDTIRLDTLRIVPGSIELVTPGGEIIERNLYRSDPMNSLLIFDSGFPYRNIELVARYRVFTADPSLTTGRKDTSIIIPAERETADPYRHTPSYPAPSADIWREEVLSRTGSISRGISFGNNQDVIVNSSLNLQLSGKLDDNLNIVASISDQNIPLQPEGYSQQIHEFDRIFIQLFNDNLSLTAGDFEVRGGGGSFIPIEKKAQGVQFSAVITPDAGLFHTVSNTASAAISKGRYHRNSFTGTEGNQGPYKLRGANNELFIIVLAGSERVFIDGRLMTRGVDRDYIIDYNLAEITFTSEMPVTKDRRIIVEFEYSDRNYARFMLSNTTGLTTGRGSYFLNVFSEHDARNQPLRQELKDEEKQLLSGIGDSLHLAWVHKIDSLGFRNDIVMYEKRDTVVNGSGYTIYKFSADPEKAHYSLSFTHVGENRGSYLPERNAANGRVFRWVAPANGTPSGTHEPVMLLVTPKKQQVVSMGGTTALAETTGASFELALSNKDLNTFSGLDNDDNTGIAFRIGLDNDFFPDGEGNGLATGIHFDFAGSNFSTTERYKPVEYERDWNLVETAGKADEHRLNWYGNYNRAGGDFVSYNGEYLTLAGSYSGLRNRLEAGTDLAGFDSRLMLSYLNSSGNIFNTGFLRHEAEISRPVWFLRLGIRTEGEDNRIEEKAGNILSSESFAFIRREIFLRNQDTAKFHFFTAYSERDDKLPFSGNLEPVSFAREVRAGFRTLAGPGNMLAGTVNYRRLEPESTHEGQPVPENSFGGRLETGLRLLKGSIQTSGFYETGSGLETKREFLYIEVARGQGTHIWIDYNGNGVKELDEFEPSVFPDEADHIRVFLPGDDYVRTRSNQLSKSISLNAPAAWRSGNGLKRVISWFSGRTAFRASHKTGDPQLPGSLSPFMANLADTNLINISSSLRHSVSFQPGNRRFSMEYLHRANNSKNLLVNGFDTRQVSSDALNTRLEVTPSVILNNHTEKGNRVYRSEFFPGRDFDIEMFSSTLSVNVQPGYSLQTSVHVSWFILENRPGSEKARKHNLGSELSYTIMSKGNISVRADYFYIDYNAPAGTPLAREMLEGLRPGNNMTMTARLQHNITGSLQLSVNYSGRSVPGSRFIHTGGMQMMAYF